MKSQGDNGGLVMKMGYNSGIYDSKSDSYSRNPDWFTM